MATAYLAIQESLGRPVVLKVLHTARSVYPKEVERFKKEGRIIASLNHPNIITVFDIDTAGDVVYLAMEYVEGGDLRKRMSGVLTPYEALDILINVGGALSAAHKKGIIHRDVKPANILFRKDGTPLLSDFGIAKQTAGDNDLTQTGIFPGKPQLHGPRTGRDRVDRRPCRHLQPRGDLLRDADGDETLLRRLGGRCDGAAQARPDPYLADGPRKVSSLAEPDARQASQGPLPRCREPLALRPTFVTERDLEDREGRGSGP